MNEQICACGNQNCACGSNCRCYKCLSWSSIIVAALVGIGLSFLLNVFAVSIGLAAFKTTGTGVNAMAVGGFIGLLIGVIATMFVMGWVAGYLGKKYSCNRRHGVLYGFASWCLALILTVILASHATRFISTYYQALYTPQTGIVKMLNQRPSVVMVTQDTANDASKATTTVNTADTTTMGLALFLAFVLFFVGAVSSCFGGYFGCKPSGCCPSRQNKMN